MTVWALAGSSGEGRVQGNAECIRFASLALDGAEVPEADTCLMRGDAYKALGRKADARRDYDLAVERYSTILGAWPKDRESYLARGHAYEKSGRMKEAQADYRKAKSLGPRTQ